MFITTIFSPYYLNLSESRSKLIITTKPIDLISQVRTIVTPPLISGEGSLAITINKVVKEYCRYIKGSDLKECSAGSYGVGQITSNTSSEEPCIKDQLDNLVGDCWLTIQGNKQSPFLYYSFEWTGGLIAKQCYVYEHSQLFIHPDGTQNIRSEPNDVGIKTVVITCNHMREANAVYADSSTKLGKV